MNTRSNDPRATKSPSGSPTAPIVFVVDDDVSVRESLKSLFDFVGIRSECFASAKDFLARPRPPIPSCLLLDVNLPDVNGLDFQEQVVADRVDMPIIFITGYGDVPMTVRAMKAGAVEFLTKPLNDDVLLSAIERAFERSRVALESEGAMRSLRERYATLSPREREIMALVVSGLLNKQIGGELGISEITVKAHRGSVMRKMEASSLPSLVSMAAMLRSPAQVDALARGDSSGETKVPENVTAAEHAVAPSFAFGPFVLVPGRRSLLKNGTPVRLGGRAFDILTVLVKRAGVLVDKLELLASVWPNTIVDEGNLNVNMSALRRVLGDVADAPAYIATTAGRGYRFIAPVQALASDGPALVPYPATHASHGLPPTTTQIVGRDAAISGIRHALNEFRLVSIVGAGGIGKSTVAVAVALAVENEQDGSVTFVDLARVASQEFVPAALMAALGISSLGGDSLHAVASILAKRKVLLLFDTCEHVLGAVAHIASFLLSMTTDVRILATSRQVLGVHGEKVEWLGPLEVPPRDEALTADQLLRFSAPQLLLLRASEKAGYRFHDSDTPALARICERLDGAPLAIELVSARFSFRSADKVLSGLDQRFSTLRGDTHGGPLRQQTLLATLEWSYSLLTTLEAAVLRSVSIFAGAFDMDAAASVLSNREIALGDAFDAIAGLRSKSMLTLDPTPRQVRYRLLDTTREFALGLLKTQGELEGVSASHARHQLEILTRGAAEHATLTAATWHAIYGRQADDLRKALDWALYRRGDPMLGVQLVAAGLPLLRELSLGEEIQRNCERALAELEALGSPDLKLKLALTVELAAANTYFSTDPSKAAELFTTAVQLARQTSDAMTECRALGSLASFQSLNGQDHLVESTLDAMRNAALRTNVRHALWEYEQLHTMREINTGNFRASYARLTKVHTEMRDYADGAVPRFQVHQKANVNVQFACMAWVMGDTQLGERVVEEAAQEVIAGGHGLTLLHCLSRGVIWLLCELQRYQRATYYTDIMRSAIYRHGMASWIPIANAYSEAIPALSGGHSSIEGLRMAFDGLRQGTAYVRHHSYYATIAKAMIAIGEVADAKKVIDLVSQQRVLPWILPEYRLFRAAIERASGRDHDAQELLEQALQAADDSGALAWKLRTALDLARLLRDRGKPLAARNVLAPVYAQFTDGSDTGDLGDCRELLTQLLAPTGTSTDSSSEVD